MTWTKSSTKTLPATGNRTVTMITEDGVQKIRYQVIDNDGDGHVAQFTVAAVLAAHPEVDAAALATTLAAFRSYGDAQCGFTDI